jgi:hypothetical protein
LSLIESHYIANFHYGWWLSHPPFRYFGEEGDPMVFLGKRKDSLRVGRNISKGEDLR